MHGKCWGPCPALSLCCINGSYNYNYMSIQSALLIAINLYPMLWGPKRTLGGTLGVLFRKKGTEAWGDRMS